MNNKKLAKKLINVAEGLAKIAASNIKKEEIDADIKIEVRMPVTIDVMDGRIGGVVIPHPEEIVAALKNGKARISSIEHPRIERLQKRYDFNKK